MPWPLESGRDSAVVWTLESQGSLGGGEDFGSFITVGGGSAGHVGFPSALAAGDGGKVFDEVPGAEAGIVSVFPAKGSEVELVAVIDDEEGGVGEVDLLTAIQELLKQSGGPFGADDHVPGEVLVGNERVGKAGSTGSFRFLEGFLGFDRLQFDFGCGGSVGNREGVGIESFEGFVGSRELFEGFGFFGGFFFLLFGEEGFGSGAAEGFDAADTGSGGAFGFDFEEADLGSVADVGSAAEFHGVSVEGFVTAADLHDADEVAVFIAEELHDVFVVLHLGVGDFDPGHGVAGLDGGVHFFLDGGELFGGDGLGVEVESESVGGDAGALLGGIG